MKSFENGWIERQPISHNVLRSVRLLGEFKGHEALYRQQMPQILETLRQVAVIQSTEASNRIEGVVAAPERLLSLMAKKTTPKDRPEQEIAGYRDILNTIHAQHAHIPVTIGVVLQFHRDLYKYAGGPAGKWKTVENEIAEVLPDGTRRVLFHPVSAFQTPEYMEQLHSSLQRLRNGGVIDELILIPAYILDFLCIHPFMDGNGRMARLLTLLLLYQAGYQVGRFISLEATIERSKESYYDTLRRSSEGWHEGEHDLKPWTEYFLGVLIAAYTEFEGRVGSLKAARGTKTQMVTEAIGNLPDGFQMKDVERLCPTVTRDMIRVVINKLKVRGKLHCEGLGRAAIWRKSGIGGNVS